MAVPRTPRPPIIAPKQAQPRLDPNEVERWIGRLARAIRLKRIEGRFLVQRRDPDTFDDAKDLEYRKQ